MEWGVRGSCDVPTKGYLILSVRGEPLACAVWFWEIKEAVQILAGPSLALLLSGPEPLKHTQLSPWIAMSALVAVMRQ